MVSECPSLEVLKDPHASIGSARAQLSLILNGRAPFLEINRCGQSGNRRFVKLEGARISATSLLRRV